MKRPRPITRRKWWLYVLVVGPLWAAMIFGWVFFTIPLARPYVTAIGAILIGVPMFWLWGYLTRRGLRKRLAEHGNALCPRCTYPITENTERCPECGEVIDYAEVVQRWEQAMRGP